MVKACCACKYQSMRADGIKMHSFPSDPQLREQWVSAMNKENFKLSHTHVICSQHFKPECYRINKKKNFILLKDSVPSIFGEDLTKMHAATKGMMIYDSETEDLDSVKTGEIAHIVDSNIVFEYHEDHEDNAPVTSPTATPNECIIFEFIDEHPGDKEPVVSTVEIRIDNEQKSEKDDDVPTSKTTTTTTEELERILAGDNEYEMEVDNEETVETTDNETPTSPPYQIEITKPEENAIVENVSASTTAVSKENGRTFRNRKQPHFVGDFIFEDLIDDVQSKKYWVMSHRVIDEQKKKLRFYSSKIRKLEKRVRELNDTVNELQLTKCKIPQQKIVYTPSGCYTL